MKSISAIAFCAAVGLLLAAPAASYAVTATDWVEYSSNPVYNPGKAYYPCILKEGDAYTMWSDANSGVQVATSTDGINWTTIGSVSGLTNPRHTVVEKIDDGYRMWYWNSASLYYLADIRTAVSADGLTWTGDAAITQVGSTVIDNSNPIKWNRGSYGPADVFYNPAGSATIVEPVDKASVWANKYVMYYDGTTGGDESIGLAVSNDGVNWQGYNGGVTPVLAGTGVAGDWDEEYVSRCTVLRENGDAYHMWYSGGLGSMDDGIGYAFSTDGINWTREEDPIFHIGDGVAWRGNRTYTPMVIGDEMWFTGRTTAEVYTIGYATAVPEPGTLALLAFAGLAALAAARFLRR